MKMQTACVCARRWDNVRLLGLGGGMVGMFFGLFTFLLSLMV